MFYKKAKTKEQGLGLVCSNSYESLAVECVCVHVLICYDGVSIRAEMNGLHDLKMYSRCDYCYRVRADKPDVGLWLE